MPPQKNKKCKKCQKLIWSNGKSSLCIKCLWKEPTSKMMKGLLIGQKLKTKVSEATKKKLSILFKGKKLSKEIKDRISLGQSGEKCWRWKGGKYISKTGYVVITLPFEIGIKKRQQFEHIIIMEKHLKRKLHKNECVHHIDKDKTNNKLKNLLLMTKSEHIKLHLKERYNKD